MEKVVKKKLKKKINKTHSLLVIVVLLAVIAGIAIFSLGNNRDIENEKGMGGNTHIVNITLYGFSPLVLDINKGDKVTFVNYDKLARWLASNTHPTHKIYPGSDIAKCGTPAEGEIFDSCRGLNQGESYSFVFNEIGSWRYHDHLRPSFTGTIIVS